MDLEYITSRLHVKPTVTQKKSEKKYAGCDFWGWDTDSQNIWDLQPLFDEIMKKFSSVASEFSPIVKKFDASLSLEIVIEFGPLTTGFVLEHELIHFADSIGAYIDVDTYLNH